MVGVHKALRNGVALTASAAAGALLATTLAATAAPPQDPQVQAQIQQALNQFQNQLRTELSLLQMKITGLENNLQNLRLQRDIAAVSSSGTNIPTPADPIPGATTFGRLTSQSVQSERYVARSAGGEFLAQLGMTVDGPGLVVYDTGGRIAAVLVATASGAELRLADADGNLQTVAAAR